MLASHSLNKSNNDIAICHFNGSSNSIQLGQNSGWHAVTNENAKTISFWMKADTARTQCLWNLNDDSGWHKMMVIYTTSSNIYATFVATGEIVQTTYAMTYTDGWHHIVMTLNAASGSSTSTVKLYTDGILRDTTSLSTTGRGSAGLDFSDVGRYSVTSDDGSTTALGPSQPANEHYDGKMCHLSIHNTEASAAVVTALFNGGTPINDLTTAVGDYNIAGYLQGWYKFGADVNNYSTHGSTRNGSGSSQPTFMTEVGGVKVPGHG